MAYSKHALMGAPMEKTALSFEGLKPLLTSTPVMTAGAVLALEAGSGALSSGVSKLKNMYERHQSYKGMLELAPSLRQQDQGTVKRYFNSLHRLNPHLMNDPLVAGGIVSQAIESQEAMGGLKQPAMAISRMAGDLVKGRSDFASAMSREGTGPNLAQHLRPVVQAGFEQAKLLRLGDTPEGKLLKQVTEKSLALRDAEAQAAKRDAIEKFEAAKKDRIARLRQLSEQEDAMRARLRALSGPPSAQVSRRGSPATTVLPQSRTGPGGVYVSPSDHPYPPTGGIKAMLTRSPGKPTLTDEEAAERLTQALGAASLGRYKRRR
jgi:hypothetical protein